MRFISTEVPTKIVESFTSYVSKFYPFKKLDNGNGKYAIDDRKASPSTNLADQSIANGPVSTTGKKSGAVLDGAIEKRFVPVEFEWTGPGDQVFITGTFYNWTVKIPLNKKSNKFYARIDLPKGHHEFKFVVNGIWKSSLRYPTTTNGYGDVNNYVDV